MKFQKIAMGGVLFVTAVGPGALAAVTPENPQAIEFKGESKRDPFIPLITPSGYLLNLEPEKDKAMSLEGIMYDPQGDSIAVINGTIVRVGDEVNGGVVVRIEPDRVSILKDNQTSELALTREEQ